VSGAPLSTNRGQIKQMGHILCNERQLKGGNTMLINDAESEEPGKDSAEVQGSTYVIDGIPMSFAEMVAYREAKAETARKATAAQQAEKQTQSAERREAHDGSAELGLTVFVIDGKPMSLDEAASYQEAREERARKATAAMMAQQAEEQAAYDAKDKLDALHADDYISNAVLATTDI
jgi:hypothetical protein